MDIYTTSRSEFLYPFIKLIVFYSNEKADLRKRYTFFPNVGSSLTFHFDTEFYATSYTKFISKEKKGSSGHLLQLNRIDPVEITDIGKQDRITIVFKPLGINHFIPLSLRDTQRDQNSSAINFRFSYSSEKLTEHLREPGSNDKKVELVKLFLEKNFHEFDHPVLKEIIQLLLQSETNEKLSVIAKKAGAGTKTMDRLFHEHMCISPVEFRRIVQFRNSIGIKLSGNANSFTQIAFESNYYDLPYMMKTYKSLTKQKSRNFFDSLHNPANGGYLYHEYL